VCSDLSAASAAGSVAQPVESAIRTRRHVRLDRKVGKARRGFDAILSSSSASQDARATGRDARKLQEMSRARRVGARVGKIEAKNDGTWFGVAEDASKRWVVPAISA
jgi:hypothetical protein